MSTMSGVRIGYVYKSRDKREDRRVCVVGIESPYAIVKNLETGRRTRIWVGTLRTRWDPVGKEQS